ncbi:hypothetical protein AVEN_75542-1 [Araneus ventricosus]|uniref:Uncharacterized protein n=1 Tax=Araneus ventricosus TaxID=182803 RepID=A0A4Y2DMU6_ARAVE|nr:hypothetical protein AVEN_75542-1 [Araneus ventricosus]
MTREERKTAVLRKGLCLVCLKTGHMAKKCYTNVQCAICLKTHYAILCPELLNTSKNAFPKQDKKEENTSTLFTIPSSPKMIYLKTLVVRLKNGGRSQYVRALLNDGSHHSYIEKTWQENLRLLPSGKETLSQRLFRGNQTPEAVHYHYSINVKRIDGKFSCQVSVLDQPKICKTLPRVHDKHLLAELENHGIVLTDTGEETPPLRLLLGAGVLEKILTGKIEVLKAGISAIETSLGWSVLGSEKKTTVVNRVTLCLQNSEIPKIWELEKLDIVDPTERKATTLLEDETLANF